MTVTVKYMYPIYAEVDLVEGAVVRVAVDDEASSQAVEVLDGALDPVGPDVRDAALRVAESTLWPSWDYGW
ncbi:MAG: hypothetical protein KA973_03960 [Candidatus Microthrix sp.]|jgi:hypothetical protein|nr:hypothetical protein [Candidatus Microthrix sp.]MBP7404063.1 hypothetical protein [Candidatus Microthrix sp.]MBP9620711.1 hypothetical protein [Candidatus Microthrix sp.]